MAGLKALAGDTVWYGLSSIIGRMITYFLVPLYTGVFATAEYGIVTELYAYVAFLLALYTYGMETAYFRYASKAENRAEIYNLSLSAIIASSLILSGTAALFADEIANLLGYEGHATVIYLLALIIAIDAIVAIPYAKLRLEKKAKKFAFIRLFNVALTVVLNLFFFVFCYQISEGNILPELQSWVAKYYDAAFKVKYVFWANFLANAAVLFLLWKEFKVLKFRLDPEKLKPILIYAFPLLIMSLAVVTNEMLSRSMLKYWLPEGFYPGKSNQAVLGIFGACYKLSVFMLLGIQAFRYAAEPFFFSSAGDKNSPKLFTQLMSGFIIFNALVFFAISVNLQPISMVFLTNPEYREALYIVPFLLLGYLFSGINYNLSVWYKVSDKTRYGAWITATGALITFVLNYLLIPIYGYFGSAIATLATFVSMTLLSYFAGQKHYPIPYDWRKALEYLTISSVGVALLFNLDLGHWMIDFLIKNSAVVLFIAYIYFRERKHISGRIIFGFRIP
ncbi:lipopolysaccharide biosynthesis protein [Reichenbachiella sp. MSK19-1]|uniref:lipopolysaccharide biosynthesis protein n=1 Tax=Reichenbachiella sp. MSK19-1 TaxID=1897631 RepID=UPI000E6C3A00|nr:polysaccharide biosynthesis C-terminal domain-containing protein [Reichenbachiella sp. MSK19-1]RJE71849.1 hypothetical protein BGP76_07105 [Reichenbachiella sp. MSK19-1]